ncbi:MAG TPA: DUF1194 domain-containing protein [Lichenihabitans sp.]|jgi:hypothetical protein|nr:DUF1194 domain-containing protein [Lichenihabitans sp.]
MRLSLVVLFGLALATAARAAEKVDLMLVLAADVSRSIDFDKYELQRKGYAAAMSDPEVLRAIAAGPTGRIAVAFVEWAGAGSQKLVIEWTEIGSAAQAQAFGARVAVAPRSFYDRTAIGSAIDFSAGLFAAAPFEADRHIIDLSGDGASNGGRDIRDARDDALAHGITAINGIVIMSNREGPSYLVEHTHPPGGLDGYYRQNVIGGVNAFVAVASGFETFGRSLVAKLIQEIS